MPFLGQQPKVGGYHVLDALTASATNTYNLQLGSIAFSPESANHLLVSLNGVIQKPGFAFTVSGSQITFNPTSGTLTSSDTIDFIMALGDVMDIGIPSDSTVTGSKLASNIAISTTGNITGAEVSSSNYEIDQWRLNAAFSTDAATITNWERPDDASFAKIGTGMSESSGVFTFPSTGVWLVTVHANIQITGSDTTAGISLQVSSNSGGAYDTTAQAFAGDNYASGNQHSSCQSLVNVTNASTYRVLLQTDSMDNAQVNGSTNITKTGILFERKGPSQ